MKHLIAFALMSTLLDLSKTEQQASESLVQFVTETAAGVCS